MGSVMIWRTNDERVSVAPSLAGHELPSPQPNLPREYILDGLQRLSTLYVALRGPGRADADADAEDDNGAEVGYDLHEQDFIEIDDEPQQGVLPLDVLGSTVALLKAQRRWSGSEAETWVERSDDLARAFREYQIPVVTLVSNDLELAIRTFKMVHSQGQPMGEADMVRALVWGPGVEIRDRLQALRDELLGPLGWGELDDETVLHVVKADANIDLYDRSAEAVSQRIREDPTRLDSAVRRLAETAKLLGRQGIRSWGLVPYSMQAILIAAAIDEVVDVREVEQPLGDWFWLTTLGEMFAGLSGYSIATALSDLRTTMRDRRVRWSGAKAPQLRALPRAASLYSPRIKALALRLAAAQHSSARDAGDPFELLASNGRQALVRLLTTRHASRASCSSPANRFLCPPSELSELRRAIMDDDIDAIMATAHLIPPEAVSAARTNDWNGFVGARLSHIESLERAQFTALRDKHGV